MKIFPELNLVPRGLLLAVSTATFLSACGGGSDTNSRPVSAVDMASGVTTLQLQPSALPTAAAQQVATPGFHVAPVILNAPDTTDAVDNAASARKSPRIQLVPDEFKNVSTRRLTLQALQTIRQTHEIKEENVSVAGMVNPLASTAAVVTYTPAQIRAAYGFPTLPAAGATLTAAQAASLGAGQTIYLIDAMSDPNVAAELAAFNQAFGLPACATTPIASTASLPLSAASKNACQFSVVYSTTSGTMTSTAPAYNSGWATEIALDVQWSHATSPLARIVLIEVPDASLNSLLAGINLANAMGPGAVSMSFGSPEGSWTASVDSSFTVANMSYFAATGDSGAGVIWPSVSTHVMAVGGTSLTYSGSGTRSETGWADTGGGTSAYTAVPSYQNSSVPGMGAQTYRTVADVSFNANPNTGQYLAVISPGSSTVSWLSAGGTSLATPQWAGLVTIANAERALVSKTALGASQTILYDQISNVPASYASAFLDVTQGSDGSCAACIAKVGYDQLTGLGTPNATSLLNILSGTSTAIAAPVVTPASISGTVGTALSFTVSVTAPDAVTYSLSGAPSGMAISSVGAVTWATPVAGTYAVTVSAKDSKTGLSGSGLYTVTIANPTAPVVNGGSISGKVGTALSFTVAVTSPDPLTYTLAQQPSGMTISSAGLVTWATPVAGSYAVTVSVKDTKTGLTGKGVYSIVIAAKAPPTVASANINGTVGVALSFGVTATAPDAVTYTLGSGAPSGMVISSSGEVSWAKPVAGTYAVAVTAKDSVTGLSGTGVYTVTISVKGPVVTAPAMTGQVGKVLTGSIIISDPTATALSVSISGVPMGMTFSVTGLTITATWANPVAGTYSMKVVVTDSAGLSTTVTVPVTVTH
ncbi:S53 family peptidase [Solimicrobium silvestre]|uniref:Peptidase S53 domain-containing protein n=1 Tax=Solimicrobium silvestre TaxID=2099400 RepID=A0A2S9H2B4_9BURK|nr:S53 family peptidase [Solimicrobium silvestre]PRC94097.1 hypothetical protein S2091_1270 [Solimicrobium silvestre]